MKLQRFTKSSQTLKNENDSRAYRLYIRFEDPYAEDYGKNKHGLWPSQYRANKTWKKTRSHQYR